MLREEMILKVADGDDDTPAVEADDEKTDRGKHVQQNGLITESQHCRKCRRSDALNDTSQK